VSSSNSVVTAERAKEIFLKSKLSLEVLGQIWCVQSSSRLHYLLYVFRRSLTDTQNRGALDVTEFTIGMFLMNALLKNQISSVPSALSPRLYEQAKGTSFAAGSNDPFQSVFGSPSNAPSPLRSQMTGSGTSRTTLNTGPKLPIRPTSIFGDTGVGSHPFLSWDVTASEKASSDQYFDALDQDQKGYITGDVAGPFLLQSKLDEASLARVWCVDIDPRI
jgi:epidermal growth factor receptor substrate 15